MGEFMEYNNLIYDEEVIKKFLAIMPEATPLETYFISLSARNKYLTEEERVEYGLGRTEMFHQQIVRHKDEIVKYIRRMETPSAAFTTKLGKPIPSKTIVCYINLFCSSTVKALEEFNSLMNRNLVQLAVNSIEGKSNIDAMKAINKAPKALIDCYQRARGSSKFIDVDFDIPKSANLLVNIFCDNLAKKGVKSWVVDTKSGFHVLLHRATLKHNFNLDIDETRKAASIIAKDENWGKWEVEKNENLMIALPGTIQGGHKVSFYEYPWEDWKQYVIIKARIRNKASNEI